MELLSKPTDEARIRAMKADIWRLSMMWWCIHNHPQRAPLSKDYRTEFTYASYHWLHCVHHPDGKYGDYSLSNIKNVELTRKSTCRLIACGQSVNTPWVRYNNSEVRLEQISRYSPTTRV